MSEKIDFNYNKMTPFKWFIIENFPFLEDSIDGPTNYTLLCKLGDEINKNRDSINEIGLNAEALTEGYNALVDYVNNYFDNLDVQDEINEKLDSLVLDGTLTNLISSYLDPKINVQNAKLNTMENEVQNIINQFSSIASGSPLVASSVSEMTDTSRVYVNTSDGKWYYYNGTAWTIGGDYQSTGIANDSITPDMTKMWVNNSLLPKYNWKIGKVYNLSTGNLMDFQGSYNEQYVDVHESQKLLSSLNSKLPYNGLRVYFYDEDYNFIANSGTQLNQRTGVNVPENAYYARYSIWPLQATEMPDNFIVYDVNSFNLNINPYSLKDYFEKSITRSDKISLYDPYFEIMEEPYNTTYATMVNVNKNIANVQYVNTTTNITYCGIQIKGDFKAGDIIKFKTPNYDRPHKIYPYSLGNVSLAFAKVGDFYTVTLTQQLIDANTSPFKAFIISNAVLPSTSTIVTYEVYVNDCPISFNQFANNLKESVQPQQTLNAIVLGDSITALTGNRSWLTYFNEIQPINVIQNVAVSGAWLNDKTNTVYDGNPVFDGADNNENNVLGNQVQKIINNNYSEPDIILIAIGTNNGINCTEQEIYDSYYDTNGNLIPLSNVDRKTSAGAYRYCNTKLRELYPNATIFWCSPIQAVNSTRNLNNVINWSKNLELLTKYSSSQFIDSEKCGITGYTEISGQNGLYLIDGLHPNENGAKYLGYYNATKVKEYCDQCKLLNS